MLSTQNPHIEKAVGVLMNLSQDEQVRLREEAREKERRDNSSRMKGAMQEGILKDKLEGKRETAQQMLLDNLPIESIAKYTGFPLVEIQKLSKELH